jgi:hypothetical protein
MGAHLTLVSVLLVLLLCSCIALQVNAKTDNKYRRPLVKRSPNKSNNNVNPTTPSQVHISFAGKNSDQIAVSWLTTPTQEDLQKSKATNSFNYTPVVQYGLTPSRFLCFYVLFCIIIILHFLFSFGLVLSDV